MIQIFEYENSPIQFEVIDGQVMANATLMAASHKKKINDYLRLKSTSDYAQAVEKRYGISRNDLVTVKQGGSDQGTWIHEKIIIDLSRWLSADFAVWCDEKISELLRTGKVDLAPKELTRLEIIQLALDSELAREKAEKELAQVKELSNQKDTIIQEMSPKAVAADLLLTSNQSISIGDFAKIIGYGQNKLFKDLRNDKFLISRGDSYNMPYQNYVNSGHFEVIERPKEIGGATVLFKQTRITPKGQVYLSNRYGQR